jgi:hypothetical protein
MKTGETSIKPQRAQRNDRKTGTASRDSLCTRDSQNGRRFKRSLERDHRGGGRLNVDFAFAIQGVLCDLCG